jgi:hypothetical protein
MRNIVVSGLGLLALCAGHGLAEAPAPPAKAQYVGGPKWEYKVLFRQQIAELGNKDFAAGLNKLGDDGWEMVGVPSAVPVGGGQIRGVQDGDYYFKRPKSQAVAGGGKVAALTAEVVNEDWVILKLKSANAIDFAKTADALFGGRNAGGPRVVADPNTNSILVRGTQRQVEELRRLTVALDMMSDSDAASAGNQPRVVVRPLKYAKVADMVQILHDLFGKDPKSFRLASDERTNTLILSTTPRQAEEMENLISRLDLPTPKEGGNRKTP